MLELRGFGGCLEQAEALLVLAYGWWPEEVVVGRKCGWNSHIGLLAVGRNNSKEGRWF